METRQMTNFQFEKHFKGSRALCKGFYVFQVAPKTQEAKRVNWPYFSVE